MLSVGDGVTDDVLEEDLENTTGLLVDETGDTLHTTTTSETTDGLRGIRKGLDHRVQLSEGQWHARAW